MNTKTVYNRSQAQKQKYQLQESSKQTNFYFHLLYKTWLNCKKISDNLKGNKMITNMLISLFTNTTQIRSLLLSDYILRFYIKSSNIKSQWVETSLFGLKYFTKHGLEV